MKFRGGEFSTGTMRNFQPELTNPPRWEPYAVMPPVRFCAGGDQQ
jgi:hypothetical protein